MATTSFFADTIACQKYRHTREDGTKESWDDVADRVATSVTKDYLPELTKPIKKLIASREFLPGGRYLYASGRPFHQIANCFLLDVEDSRDGWAELMHNITSALMTGGGLGVVYSKLREKGSLVKGMGGLSTGPTALMQMVNEAGRHIMQGGSRRSALWSGLHWSHPDVKEFINLKNWSSEVRELKSKDFNFPATMDMTNISVILDDEFFEAYLNPNHLRHKTAYEIYWLIVKQMCKTGEPGFSIDVGENAGEHLRNACTEITSKDSDDVCNLASINMAGVKTYDQFCDIIWDAIGFLLCGTLYSKVPYKKVAKTRDKNRRLGLGMMGIHEWLLVRGKQYGYDDELDKWLQAYRDVTDKAAKHWSKKLGISCPVKTRAIAPTGCQRVDTLVVTNDGIFELQEMGDTNGPKWQPLNVKVAQENGKRAVATKFYKNGLAATRQIKFKSGGWLEATYNHQYRILTEDGKYTWRKVKDLKPGDKLVVALNTYKKKSEPKLLAIRKHHKLEKLCPMPDTMTPELAKFLGIFFADGSMHAKGIRIHCDAHFLDYKEVAELGKKLLDIEPCFEDNGRGCMAVYFNSSALLRWLYTNGLDKPESKDMYLPAIIRCFSRESLNAFVDGYHFGDGSRTNGVCEYIDTASYRYSLQLQCIIRALGTDVSIQQHMSGLGSMMYRVRKVLTCRKDESKADRVALDKYGLENCTVDRIIDISESECETVDIEVPDTKTYVANGVVSHNTISIIGETSGGVEPVFAVALKRRYLKGRDWHYQYIVDGAAKRIIDKGVDPDLIEDAYDLSEDVERRMAFQAFVQKYVDHGISSTINMQPWGSSINNKDTIKAFGEKLFNYLPKLRGVTVYPDGARGGQPLTKVSYKEAVKHLGKEYVETGETGIEDTAAVEEITNEHGCPGGVCGM